MAAAVLASLAAAALAAETFAGTAAAVLASLAALGSGGQSISGAATALLRSLAAAANGEIPVPSWAVAVLGRSGSRAILGGNESGASINIGSSKAVIGALEADLDMVVGDLLPLLDATLIGADGVTPVDLSTATSITFSMRIWDDSQTAIGGPCTPVGNPTAGVVRYAWQPGDTAMAGEYNCEWVVVFPAGPMTIPGRRAKQIRIRPHI